MYPVYHAAVSVLVGLAAVAAVRPSRPVAVLLAGVVAGTLIDLDHFLISRLDRGDWRELVRLARDPLPVFLGSRRLFTDASVGHTERLLSHVALGGLLVGLTWLAWASAAAVVGSTLYAHVLADLVSDVRRLRSEDASEAR